MIFLIACTASVSDLSESEELSRLRLGRHRRRRRSFGGYSIAAADVDEDADLSEAMASSGGGSSEPSSPYVVTLEDVARFKSQQQARPMLGGLPPQRRGSVTSMLSLNDDAWSYTNSSIGTASGWGSDGSGNGNGRPVWCDYDEVGGNNMHWHCTVNEIGDWKIFWYLRTVQNMFYLLLASILQKFLSFK